MLTKFSQLKFKYRISPNGFVEKIPSPELFNVGAAQLSEANQAGQCATDPVSANSKSCLMPMVHLQFDNRGSEEMDCVEEVVNDPTNVPE